MITKRRTIIIFITYSFLYCISVLLAMMFNYSPEEGFESVPVMVFSSFVIFTLAFFGAGKFSDFWSSRLHKKDLQSGLTSIVSAFIDDLRRSYSMDELVGSIQDKLEKRGDSSILLVDNKKDYVIYNSVSLVAQDEKILTKMRRQFSQSLCDGYYFFDEDLGLLSESEQARGFIVICDDLHLIVFCTSARIFAPVIFEILFEELKKFYKRYKTIANLTQIDELSQEWAMVADTQKSFLPLNMPTIDHLEIAEYFKPLINVSGDYYTVIELSKTKTLVLLGDVSGKGFSAALIMGIVINIVKTVGKNTDLQTLVLTIDKTIKDMHFEDKYTVLFVGIIDTENMNLSYINASMADICVLTKTPLGYNSKHLLPNCSIVGLVELEKPEVITIPLFWDDVIFLATDGISETTDNSGIELGETDLYAKTIKLSAEKSPREFIQNIENLLYSYSEGRKFKDDITMLVIKVER